MSWLLSLHYNNDKLSAMVSRRGPIEIVSLLLSTMGVSSERLSQTFPFHSSYPSFTHPFLFPSQCPFCSFSLQAWSINRNKTIIAYPLDSQKPWLLRCGYILFVSHVMSMLHNLGPTVGIDLHPVHLTFLMSVTSSTPWLSCHIVSSRSAWIWLVF